MDKKYGFRGATLHGINDVILSSGLAVDYQEVSKEAEKLRLELTKLYDAEYLPKPKNEKAVIEKKKLKKVAKSL